MAFGNFVLTDFGNSILVKAHAGKEIHFSRMALGDGNIGTSSMAAVTALKSEKLSLLIDAVSITDSDATVTVLLQSSAVDTGFYLKEMGLMATDPDTSIEGVYAYNRDSSDGENIPDKNSSSKLSEYLRVHCSVAGATNITFNSSGNPLWITRDELSTEVSSQISAKAGVAGGLALFDTLQAFIATKGQAGGLALYDTLKTFMDSKGKAGGLASYDNSVPTTRKINGHALSADITVTSADTGAISGYECDPKGDLATFLEANLPCGGTFFSAPGNNVTGVPDTSAYYCGIYYVASMKVILMMSTGGANAKMYVKVKDGSPSAWNSWISIRNALTADTASGNVPLTSPGLRNNTISSAAPSGGSNGDTWDQV